MDPFGNPPSDSLAAARLHVQALTECGLSREALLQALLEGYPDQGLVFANEDGGDERSFVSAPSTYGDTDHGHSHGHGHGMRLSMSTASSRSSNRASFLSTSTATSMTSVSSAPSPTQHLPKHTQLPSQSSIKSSVARSPSTTRAYWCSFCDTKFQRKFDWKRHEDEFHERYKKYPCPSCNRVFWGANTFNQHHRQAHGCTTCPHADRVVQYTKRKTAWACGFCAAFLPSRDRYFDHVAHHYEAGGTKAHWSHSNTIYGLLHQATVHQAWKELNDALYGHLPREQQPMFEWDLEMTGHAQGFLENESPGKLQDLLEFFCETRDDPRFLARMAHDVARIIPRQDLGVAQQVIPEGRPVSEIPSQTRTISRKPSMKHFSAPLRSRSSAMRLHEKFNAMAASLKLQSPPQAPPPIQEHHPPPMQEHQHPPQPLLPPPPPPVGMSPASMSPAGLSPAGISPAGISPAHQPHVMMEHQMQTQLPGQMAVDLPPNSPPMEFTTAPQLNHTGMLYQQPLVEGIKTEFFPAASSAPMSASTLHHDLFEDWSSLNTIASQPFTIPDMWGHTMQEQGHAQSHT